MLVRGSQGLDHTGFWTYGKHLPLFVVHLDLVNKPFRIQSISSSLMRHSQPSWGAALFRKPSVIGMPHCSLPEPGKPVAFHSSADAISENTLCSFWSPLQCCWPETKYAARVLCGGHTHPPSWLFFPSLYPHSYSERESSVFPLLNLLSGKNLKTFLITGSWILV